uniref:Putative secreted protein n=1 Tax=Ixodes ricinus TaxID=34613 RepID=A0A6B0U8H7_IXORI
MRWRGSRTRGRWWRALGTTTPAGSGAWTGSSGLVSSCVPPAPPWPGIQTRPESCWWRRSVAACGCTTP